jgi:hypothetical protein
MSTEQAEPSTESLNVGHDTTPANVRGIALAGVGIVVMLALTMLVAWWITNLYGAQEQPVNVPFPPEQVEQPLSPAPRLQANPEQDWQQQQEQARDLLNRYEWIDREQGTLRIPVERAIDLLAEEGLPVREDAAPASEDQ